MPAVAMRLRPGIRRALTAVLVASLAGATAVAVASPAAAAPPDPLAPAGRYVALTPQRVLDTRAGSVPLAPGQTRLLDFGGRISPAVEAVVVNVTTVNATGDGYLTLYPHGQPRPTVSNVQHPKGVARSSSVTVAVTNQGAGRYVDVYDNAGSVDIVVDLFGYYVLDPAPSGTTPRSYYPRTTPARVYDSRSTGGALANGASRTVVVTPEATTLGVTAVAVNLTVVTPGGSGYLQAWSGDGPPPVVSSVNFQAGRTTPNFAIVPVRCAPGTECLKSAITIRNVSVSAQVVVDVLGVYAASGHPGGTRFQAATPFRVLDTRAGTPFHALGPGGTTTAYVGDGGSNADIAANVTVTAVKPTGTTYLQTYLDGAPPPSTSTVNAAAGEVVANATQVLVTPDVGVFRIRNFAGTVDVVVDVNGVFVSE